MVIRHLRAPLRRAFTMIELIFAIVIIGLVAITIPTVLVSNARNVETNLLHEAILIAATKMGQNMSYAWDENSPDPLVGVLAKREVLDTASVDNELQRVPVSATDGNLSDFRVGHFREALHRRMSPASTIATRQASTVLGSDGGDMDDIDDIQGTAIAPLVTTDEHGYKQTYTISGVASYANDAALYNNPNITFNFDVAPAATVSTNIKMIEIRVDAGNTPANPDMLFRTFSSNIGESDFYKRTY